jgi:hypothetical protein
MHPPYSPDAKWVWDLNACAVAGVRRWGYFCDCALHATSLGMEQLQECDVKLLTSVQYRNVA